MKIRLRSILCATAAIGLAATLPFSAAFASGNIIVGTTDTVHTVDPANCYDFYCANVLHNTGQTLVTYASDSTKLVPDLATSMPEVSDDGLTFTFKLPKDVKFQDGSDLTSKDVKFSLNRVRWINHPEGAGFLLSDIKSIDTPDPQTVVIHLKTSDISFVSKLAYVVATIVPAADYPSPDGPISSDAKSSEYNKYIKNDFVGSGPYKIVNFTKDQSMLLSTWDGYSGKKPSNDKVLLKFYAKSPQMLVALKSGEIDVAFRHFTPDQRKKLQENSHINTFKGDGAAIRYIVFNPNLKPSDSLKVRQAIAAAIDRKRIIQRVLHGAAEPLYSMVPPIFDDASLPAFKTLYEGKKASDYLDHKVDLTLWYSRGHYGDTETKLASTIKRILDETGLFNVTLKSAEWAQFTASAYPGARGHYAAFLLGWYPDYMDPDDYLAPFFDSKASFLRMYDNKKVDDLIKQERLATNPDSDKRVDTFRDIQKILAKDVPTLPMFVITPYAFARDDISGVGDTMGPAQIFRYSVLSKKD